MTGKIKIIHKKSHQFAVVPNLADYDRVKRQFSWQKAKSEIDYIDGKLNAAYNAIERNAKNWRKNKVALYWVGEDFTQAKYTFDELNRLTNQFANLLQA